MPRRSRITVHGCGSHYVVIASLTLGKNFSGLLTGEELKPSPGKPTSSEDPEITWILKDEKAHGIIQDHISDALLMRTGDLISSKELFDKLVSLHQTSNIALAFYSFQQLTKNVLGWDITYPGPHCESPDN
ncbi:hypothetical protein SERLA73DRAFT_80541 [Serpula lacrymans var. lacrymans S7.3]|uniref:Uncharacterized protein n=1 Tax=Serpula lacrymans var. lacrymans (strain S7.3) TaxID=936435 RepID=F8QJW6_SERL3|nr:hypothetical protein SERLA73DRAFT_80541 [Serpula lacrymans var. lacrymans S7.3]